MKKEMEIHLFDFRIHPGTEQKNRRFVKKPAVFLLCAACGLLCKGNTVYNCLEQRVSIISVVFMNVEIKVYISSAISD